MEKEKQKNQLLDVKDVSGILKVSKQSVYNQLSQKRFPINAIKIGRLVRFRLSDVENYIKSL